jgi:hypothetical protein
MFAAANSHSSIIRPLVEERKNSLGTAPDKVEHDALDSLHVVSVPHWQRGLPNAEYDASRGCERLQAGGRRCDRQREQLNVEGCYCVVEGMNDKRGEREVGA